MFCDSPSLCRGLLCSGWLWYFLIILTFFSGERPGLQIRVRTRKLFFLFLNQNIQWATLVTHHFFRAHIFWQKCWNRTFSMIIYLLTFYLFDNIEKILESLMRIILLLQGNFDKFWKMHVQAERLYFLFLFCARYYPWRSLWQKNTKNNLFIQVKPIFSVVEFSNTVTFWRNARFNVI